MFVKINRGNHQSFNNHREIPSDIGHWGNGDYKIHVSDDVNLEYIMSLIKQVL
jgi:predicted transport protein